MVTMRTQIDPPNFPSSPPIAPPRRPAAADDRAARIARLQASRQASGAGTGGERRPSSGATSTGSSSPGAQVPRRRKHPAKGARTVALLSSIAATVAVGGGLAFAERPDSGGELALTVSGTGASASPTATAAKATTTTAAGATASTATSSTAPASASAAAANPAATATAAASATTAAAAAPTTAVPTTATPTTAAPGAELAPAAVTSGYADGTYLGTAEYTKWGDVQVEVTIGGGAIVDIAVVQVPSDGKSQGINNRATPVLEAQAIAIQGAELDIVSGATYTSRTYATSLQSALDQAAVAAGAQ